MPDYTAGKARILLEPSARGFFSKAKLALKADAGDKKLEQDVKLTPVATRFKAVADEKLRTIALSHHVTLTPKINRAVFRERAKEIADSALGGLYANIHVRPVVNTTYATTQMAAWRRKEEANPLRIKVITEHVGSIRRGGAGATSMVNRERDQQVLHPTQTFQGGHTVPILQPKVDEAHVAAEATRAKATVERIGGRARIKPRVDVDQSEMQRAASQFQSAWKRITTPQRTVGPSIRGVELLQPAVVALTAEALPALVTGLGEVVGAMDTLAMSALAIPGALAVVGTSVATLAIGLSGMKGAWKAMSQESDRAANQTTSDSERMDKSQEQLRHGLVEQKKAQEDLTKARKDARRELEDLHAEERSSYLSVAEAALDLQKARNELAAPSQGNLDHREKVIAELRARENLSAALRRQKRSREDVADADKKGIAGSDRVVAAQEAIAHSNEQIADTLEQIKNKGSGAANATDKVNAAMAKLSPNAGELMRTLFELKDGPLNDIAKASSQNMFAGMSDAIKNLVHADLPLLTRGFGGVASGINRNMRQITSSLNTDQNRGVLERIFGNTEEFHKRFNAAIDPMIRSLGTLAAAGSSSMPRLASHFADLSDRFSKFIDKADKDGRLQHWIDQGIDGVMSLSRSFGNVLTTLHNISNAFGQGGLLGSLERGTKKMSEFFGSARGQNDLHKMINMVKDDFEAWKPILQDIPALLAAVMGGARTAMGGILPLINVFTSGFKEFPGLAQAAVAAFVGWRAIRPILDMAAGGTKLLQASLMTLPGVARQAGMLPLVNEFKKLDIQSRVTADTLRAGAAQMAAGPGRVRTAYNNLAGSLGGAMSRVTGAISSGARNAASGLTQGLGTAISAVTGSWGPKITSAAGTAVGKMGSTMGNLGRSAAGGLTKALSGVTGFLTGPWGAAIGAAVLALAPFIEGNKDAAESTREFQRAQDDLAASLDRTTNKLGAASREKLAKEMQNYQPEHGLTGNVASAAHDILGEGGDEQLLSGILSGDKGKTDDLYRRFRDAAKDKVLESVPGPVKAGLHQHGISDDQLVDAFLGDQEQVRRVNDLMNNPAFGAISAAFDFKGLGSISVSGRALSASLAAQFLSARAPAARNAPAAAQAGQELAAGGKPKLKTGMFGTDAEPSYSSGDHDARVVAKGDWVAAHGGPKGPEVERLKEQGYEFLPFNAANNTTTIVIPSDHIGEVMDLPRPAAGRKEGGPSPELGAPGPTGGVVSELHPGEWVLPKHARSRLGDDWLWDQTKNKAVDPAFWRGRRGPGHSPDRQKDAPQAPWTTLPKDPGEPDLMPPVRIGTGAGRSPYSYEGGGPAKNVDGDEPLDTGLVPSGVDPHATNLLTQPSPTSKTPNFGDQLSNAFLSPWGFKKDPANGEVVSANAGASNSTGTMDPGTYMGQWAGNLGVALGETLLNGVAGFFGFNIDNTYFQAFKSAVGFYSGKLGGSNQNVDADTAGLTDDELAAYGDLTSGGSGDLPGLGDPGKLPAGKAPEAGLQPNAIKANRAITAAFPEIQTIGGVREDALKWHPGGLALDIMIPSEGKTGLNGQTTPEGLAEGNKIWAWMQQHADELGIDMSASLWQQPDHHNHIHLAVYGANNPAPPGKNAGSPTITKNTPYQGDSPQAPGGQGAPGPRPPTVTNAPNQANLLANRAFSRRGPKPPTTGAGSLAPFLGAPGGGAPSSGGGLSSLFPGQGGIPSYHDQLGPLGPHGQSRRGGRSRRRSTARSNPANALAVMGEPGHDRAAVAQYIYRAAISKGFSEKEAVAITAYAQGESGLNPEISGGAQGAGGSAGGDSDVVIGLFQEKPGFAQAGGVNPADRYTVSGNVTAYLNQLVAHRGTGDIYDQLLATSVGGPMYTGGRGAMTGLEQQVTPLLQGLLRHYDIGGELPQGLTLALHNKPDPDVVVPHAIAAQAVAALQQVRKPAPTPPVDAQHMQPRQPPPETNIPNALPPPGPQAQAPDTTKTADVPGAATGPAAMGAPAAADTEKSYEHPGLKQAVTSGAATAGNIASMAASAMGGGMGGPLIAGLFQQGGKIANDAINVGAAFASGFTKFGVTTENAYGVTQVRKDAPPQLGADNRRVHNGNNFFASMDEWRRQNQLQDAQDMQAGMARIK